MPLFDANTSLPSTPQRILVAGASGSGKTTLAARIAEQLGIEHIEIDSLFHGPNWVPRPTFEAEVAEFSARPGWVTEWLYGSVRPMLAERADLLVWIDLPRSLVMRQVIARTLSRRIRRTRLWNGNIEPPLWTIFNDPEHIVRWAWTTHAQLATRVLRLRRQQPNLVIVRLRGRSEIARWLAGPLTKVGPTQI